MEELKAALDEFVQNEHKTDSGSKLRSQAFKWACHAINTYQGALLRKALEVSISIVRLFVILEL